MLREDGEAELSLEHKLKDIVGEAAIRLLSREAVEWDTREGVQKCW